MSLMFLTLLTSQPAMFPLNVPKSWNILSMFVTLLTSQLAMSPPNPSTKYAPSNISPMFVTSLVQVVSSSKAFEFTTRSRMPARSRFV